MRRAVKPSLTQSPPLYRGMIGWYWVKIQINDKGFTSNKANNLTSLNYHKTHLSDFVKTSPLGFRLQLGSGEPRPSQRL